jgi:alkanesulfonate monooxygenase
MKTSDSSWHKQLSDMARSEPSETNPYWLVPFEMYKTFCPYLVGSYDRVADELARYVSVGYQTFILDVPPAADELRHVGIVFDRACTRRSVTI